MRFIKSVRDRPGTSCTSKQDELVVGTCTFGFALLALFSSHSKEELLLLSVSTGIMTVSTSSSLVLLLELLSL